MSSDDSSAIVNRVHELVAETVRTHHDPEARAALRSALVELEQLRARMLREEDLAGGRRARRGPRRRPCRARAAQRRRELRRGGA